MNFMFLTKSALLAWPTSEFYSASGFQMFYDLLYWLLAHFIHAAFKLLVLFKQIILFFFKFFLVDFAFCISFFKDIEGWFLAWLG